jgi:hypothetical protein
MKDLRCLILLHSYAAHHAPDTPGWYMECRRCGHVKDNFSHEQGGNPWRAAG